MLRRDFRRLAVYRWALSQPDTARPKESLVDEKITALKQSRVRGHEIASDQLYNVPGDQSIDRNRRVCAAATNVCLHCHRPAQRSDRVLSPHFLNEIKCYANGDDEHHDDKARYVSGGR